MDAIPVLDVSDTSATGPTVLVSARFATRLANGNIVAADQYADALRFFDPTGRPIRSVGRPGNGPGEFADITWVSRCGSDSLFVWAYSRRVIIVLDSAGAFGREFRPQGNPYELTCSSAGVFAVIGLPNQYQPPNADGLIMTAPLWLADNRGDSIRWFGDHPLAENRALGKRTRIAMGANAFYVGTGDSAWIDAWGLDGTLSGALPLGTVPQAATKGDYDRAIDQLVSTVSNRAVRERSRADYAALPMPARLPPYTDIRVDDEGLIWAVVPVPGGRTTELRAVDATGSARGDVVLPIPLTVFEVGNDYVLGEYTDSTAVEHLIMFRLHRG